MKNTVEKSEMSLNLLVFGEGGMSSRQPLKRFLPMALIALLSLTACAVQSAGLGHTMRWKEEIRLHDGQMIVVERFYNLGGYPAIESHNRSPLDETLTFTLPAPARKSSGRPSSIISPNRTVWGHCCWTWWRASPTSPPALPDALPTTNGADPIRPTCSSSTSMRHGSAFRWKHFRRCWCIQI